MSRPAAPYPSFDDPPALAARIKQLNTYIDEQENWLIDHEQEIVALTYAAFWSQIAIAFLLSYIYRVPGGNGVKLRPIDGWTINPYCKGGVRDGME